MAAWLSNQKQMQTAATVRRPTGGTTQLASRLLGGPISPSVITSASAQSTAKARETIAARNKAPMQSVASTFTVGRASAVIPENHFASAESSGSSGSGGGFSGGTVSEEPCTDCAGKAPPSGSDNTMLYLLALLLFAGGM